ncbi:MAG: TetR/AcrR family transcriptional regulator [Rhodospirillales bacterium]
MVGLREKQKEERQRRILEAARQQFRSGNYRRVTIEAIAEKAGISAMTVYNYYGSKGGLLLALVAESDRHLLAKIEALLAAKHHSALDAVIEFSLIIFDHAFSYIDRRTWEYVLASSILEGDSTFGRGYAELDRELAKKLRQLLKTLNDEDIIVRECDWDTAADVLYNIHNARFVEYASDPEYSRDKIDALVQRDLSFVVNQMTGVV